MTLCGRVFRRPANVPTSLVVTYGCSSTVFEFEWLPGVLGYRPRRRPHLPPPALPLPPAFSLSSCSPKALVISMLDTAPARSTHANPLAMCEHRRLITVRDASISNNLSPFPLFLCYCVCCLSERVLIVKYVSSTYVSIMYGVWAGFFTQFYVRTVPEWPGTKILRRDGSG
jgi:hypothetical protein